MKKKILTMGWREWVALPELNVLNIKAKVDTGARTSALHACKVHVFKQFHKEKIGFDIFPIQHNTHTVVHCIAEIMGIRSITDSGGHSEERYVIKTPISIGGQTWFIEITLTERKNMLFRMLLGRNALGKRFLVHPARSFIISKASYK